MEPGALELVILVGEILERHGVSYALGGSLASSFFGMPRSTVDVDLAVDVPLAAHDALLEDLGTVFYVPEDSARAALEGAGSFNLLGDGGLAKVDLFVLGSGHLDRWQIERRVRVELAGAGAVLWVSAPAEQVLRKLEWFRAGGEQSDRQWSDVLGILRSSGPDIDIQRLRHDADLIGLGDLVERALADEGLG